MITRSIGLKVLILPLSLALTVIIAILFIKPVFVSMNENQKALAEKKEKLADLEAQVLKLDELQRSFDTLEEKKTMAVAVPEEKSFEDYLNELYQRASRSGVIVSSFNASEQASSGNLPYICGDVADSPGALPASAPETAPVGGNLPENDPMVLTDGSVPTDISAPAACVRGSTVQIAAEGTWEQLLSFYRFLADSNRIANVSGISITPQQSQSEEEGASDLLGSQISLNIFYKPKSAAVSAATASALAGGAGFNQTVLKKLKETVYAPYEEPVVSETGERNFFK